MLIATVYRQTFPTSSRSNNWLVPLLIFFMTSVLLRLKFETRPKICLKLRGWRTYSCPLKLVFQDC